MSLTMGAAPFGHRPAGTFNVDLPRDIVYVDSFPRRVRAKVRGEPVVDSLNVKLVHQSRRLPRYSFPVDDVSFEGATPDPFVPGHVEVQWGAVDEWWEEEEQVFVHVRDPYHRIDVVPTSRRIMVSTNGIVLAESTRPLGLYETGLPIRWYVPKDDVRMDLLEQSDTATHCAYKGTPTHWHARLDGEIVDDVAWSYDADVKREAEDVRGHIAFYNERTDIDVDGVRADRPQTPWSR